MTDIEIHTLADIHFGDKFCDINLVKKKIEYIRVTPNAYCILNGDLCDNALVDSVGDTYGETHSPMDQVKMICDLLRPIKHKIICINTGTHENRTLKRTGIDLTEIIAMELGVIDKYSATSSLIFVRFGSIRYGQRQRCYTIYCLHGARSGRKVGSKATALSEMSEIVDSDVVIHSHSHFPIVFKDCKFQIDYPNSSVYLKETTYINTGAFLNYGGYAEYGEFKPASKKTPVIYLTAQEHSVDVRL